MWSAGVYLMFHQFFELQQREDFLFHSVSRVVSSSYSIFSQGGYSDKLVARR